ncbi:intradiol ring-cleavage dioxygenase [Streptomyces sp. NPDC048636]|uniref:intradiol ring-cleavage dioxygenase n=1 Tax=Streptomyces sp. NPDC048636 TaxID=3155762 RepID=UPI0034134F9B
MTSDNTSPHTPQSAAPAAPDEPTRKVERRTVLAALGIGATGLGLGATALPQASASARASGTPAASGQPACVLAPETIEGPYFIDEELIRRDITEDRRGLPLEMRITVVDGVTCTPLAGAEVDIWHCDAEGWYSGHLETSPDVPPASPDHVEPTDPSRFLRGMQTTNRRGEVRFRSIYPGWYYGRAIHVHLTVHVEGLEVHTGQLYFPEELNSKVARLEPYVRHTGTKRLTNQEDTLYVQQGGAQTTMDVQPLRPGRPELGCVASITAGVIPGQTPPEPPLPTSA